MDRGGVYFIYNEDVERRGIWDVITLHLVVCSRETSMDRPKSAQGCGQSQRTIKTILVAVLRSFLIWVPRYAKTALANHALFGGAN